MNIYIIDFSILTATSQHTSQHKYTYNAQLLVMYKSSLCIEYKKNTHFCKIYSMKNICDILIYHHYSFISIILY